MSIRFLIRKFTAPVSMPSHKNLPTICGFAVLLIGVVPTAHAEPNAIDTSADTQTSGNREPATRRVGEATTTLLATQVDGSMAGPGLPMLGATGNLSWQRYLDSFKYKIPETFNHKIDESGSQ